MKFKNILFITTLGLLLGNCGTTKNITDDQKRRELIKNEFLTTFYREVSFEFKKIDRAELPLPHFIGDEFALVKPLRIGEILNADSSISFDINKGSLIPAGHKLKILKKKGSIYFIRTTDQNDNNEQINIISERSLKSYFDPNYYSSKVNIFDSYEKIVHTLIKRISEKYNLTRDEVIGIIDSYIMIKKE